MIQTLSKKMALAAFATTQLIPYFTGCATPSARLNKNAIPSSLELRVAAEGGRVVTPEAFFSDKESLPYFLVARKPDGGKYLIDVKGDEADVWFLSETVNTGSSVHIDLMGNPYGNPQEYGLPGDSRTITVIRVPVGRVKVLPS